MRHVSSSVRFAGAAAAMIVMVTCRSAGPSSGELVLSEEAQQGVARAMTAEGDGLRAQVERGRALVLSHGCGDCHGGVANPGSANWLAGMRDSTQEFVIGPFRTRPRNLTPDNATGVGRFSERQLFNALRFGLRPGETADVEITSMTPGEGNFPANPKYLAPPMPWPAFRNMQDDELQAIAVYLKNGVLPVSNRVKDSDGPPDFWASEYTPEKIGPYPPPAYPTTRERLPNQ